MPVPIVLMPFAIATALVVFGAALATNWRSFANRYTSWAKRTFGPFGGFGGVTYTRVLGVIWIALGLILYVSWATSVASGTATR